jgi:transcriptional regulator with XRE-family HTH domain
VTNNPENPLAERLRSARKAGMTQTQLAVALQWAPSKISKIESGRQLPSQDDLAAWALATGVGESTLQTWQSMLDQARAQHQLWSDQMRAGQATVQMGFQELVDSNTYFRFYEKTYIPLFLQTPAYTRASLTHIKSIFQPDDDLELPAARRDIDRAVAARQASASRLFDSSYTFEFILDEAVLRSWRYSTQIWRDQLIRLTAAVGLSNVRLGILPLDRITTVFDTNSFEMYGDVISIEVGHGENRYIESEIVNYYSNHMTQLWVEAVTGDDAIQLIEKARRAIPD